MRSTVDQAERINVDSSFSFLLLLSNFLTFESVCFGVLFSDVL